MTLILESILELTEAGFIVYTTVMYLFHKT